MTPRAIILAAVALAVALGALAFTRNDVLLLVALATSLTAGALALRSARPGPWWTPIDSQDRPTGWNADRRR